MALTYIRQKMALNKAINAAVADGTISDPAVKAKLNLRCDDLTKTVNSKVSGNKAYLSQIDGLRAKILDPTSHVSASTRTRTRRSLYGHRPPRSTALSLSSIKSDVDKGFTPSGSITAGTLQKYKSALKTKQSTSLNAADTALVQNLTKKIQVLEILLIAKDNNIDPAHPLLIILTTVYREDIDVPMKNAMIQSALEQLNPGYNPLVEDGTTFSEHVYGSYWAASGSQDNWDAKNHIAENPEVLLQCLNGQFQVMLNDRASGARHVDKDSVEFFAESLEKSNVGGKETPLIRLLSFSLVDSRRRNYDVSTSDAKRVYVGTKEPLKNLQEIIDQKETSFKLRFEALESAKLLFPELGRLNPISQTFSRDLQAVLTHSFALLGKKNDSFKYLIWKLHHDAWIADGSPAGKEPGGDDWGGKNFTTSLPIFVQAITIARTSCFTRLEALKKESATSTIDRPLLLATLHDAAVDIVELKSIPSDAADIFAEIDKALDQSFTNLEKAHPKKASSLKFLIYKHHHDAWEKNGKTGDEPGSTDSDYGNTHKRDSYELFFVSFQKVTAVTKPGIGTKSAFTSHRAAPALVPSTPSTVSTASGVTVQRLHNPSQNCWINALMQFLILNPELKTKFLDNIPTNLPAESERAKFKQFADAYIAGNPVNTQSLREALHTISNSSLTATPISSSCYRAEDASEALNHLGGCFGTFQRAVGDAPRVTITPFVNDLHTEAEDIRCYHRGHVGGADSPLRELTPQMLGELTVDPANSEIVYSSLSLRELSLKVTLAESETFHFEDLLEKTFKHPAVVGSDSARYDGADFEIAEIRKQYTKTPETLLLQLNRYGTNTVFTETATESVATLTKYKINNNIDVAEEFVLPDGAIKEDKKPLAPDGVTRLNPVYSLTGFVLHSGGLSGGHYTAYIKKSDTTWILCNDSSITEITHATAMERSKQCYITSYTHSRDITDADKAALRQRRQDAWNAAAASSGIDATSGKPKLNTVKKAVQTSTYKSKKKPNKSS